MSKFHRIHHCTNCNCESYWERSSDYSQETQVEGWECNNCGHWEAKRVTTFTASSRPGYRTPSQKRALENIKRYITNDLNPNPEYGDEITKFEITPNSYDGSLWLVVQTEMVGLPENNLLRALDHQYWHFHIGRGGKVVAHSYPNSFDQFKGQKVFGFWVK